VAPLSLSARPCGSMICRAFLIGVDEMVGGFSDGFRDIQNCSRVG